jgi:16S rRNA (uracil1498-N3)-methyltransferase
MKYPRLYHPENLNLNEKLQLCENAFKHAIVLRLSISDKIILFNNSGYDYLSEIIEIKKKNIMVSILEKIKTEKESILDIHLGQAVSRSDKMDWMIQKAVELGVKEITPLITQYCNAKASQQKLEHWVGIIISSCEQCGRNKIPILNPAVSLSEWLEKSKITYGLIFDPEATQSLSSLSQPKDQIHLLIGPEGGFSLNEIELSKKYHFQSVRLGNRILRTETAAITAISALQTLFGDFR